MFAWIKKIFFTIAVLVMATWAHANTPSDTGGRAGIDYPSAWACDQSKFNWYCDIEERKEEAKPPKAQAKPETAMERLERLQKALKEARAKAILEPMPENVAEYIRLQNEVTQMASVFSDVWRRVIWQRPELNYELKRPVHTAGIDTYNNERQKAEIKTLDEIKKEWGVFFFFKSDCPYCHRMAPSLKMLTDMYGMTVFPVSVDGQGLPEYPNPQRDNGMAARLGITQVPMLVLGNIKDRRLIPIGSGVISIQDVIERIYILTSTRPGDLY
jgi:conjugal transfer pilus assembly protein TraF